MKYHLQLAGFILSGLFLLANQSVFAAGDHDHHQHREHDAHEHGAALLNVVIDENSLHLELESPAMNIVGFEHAPKTQKQKNAVARAATELKNGTSLFVLPSTARCQLAEVEVESPLLKKEDHKHKKTHAHDKHEDEHKESHSEFNAAYVFQCKNINALKEIDVQLFNKFKAIEEIKVQLISDKGQTVKELTAKQHKLVF